MFIEGVVPLRFLSVRTFSRFLVVWCDCCGMRPSEHAEGLYLAYENGEAISFVETNSGNRFNGVSISDVFSVNKQVERMIGVDASGVKVCFDIRYDLEGGVADIQVRRGQSMAEYGELKEFVIG